MQCVLGIRKGVRYRWLRFWRRGSAGRKCSLHVKHYRCTQGGYLFPGTGPQGVKARMMCALTSVSDPDPHLIQIQNPDLDPGGHTKIEKS